MRFAMIQVVVNIVLGVGLFMAIGFQGIAAATSVASWLSVFLMLGALARRGHYAVSAHAMARIARIAAASVVLGLVLAFASHERTLIEHAVRFAAIGPLKAKEPAVALVCALAVPLYGALLFLLGGVRPSELKRAIRRG
jgi:putative peptidoglycan lipid II flippase